MVPVFTPARWRSAAPMSAAHWLLAEDRVALAWLRIGYTASRLRRWSGPLGASTGANAPSTAPFTGSLMVALTEFHASWL